MTKPNAVNLTGTCPHCGEAVEMTVTKKQIKEIYKAFKLSTKDAQLKTDFILPKS